MQKFRARKTFVSHGRLEVFSQPATQTSELGQFLIMRQLCMKQTTLRVVHPSHNCSSVAVDVDLKRNSFKKRRKRSGYCVLSEPTCVSNFFGRSPAPHHCLKNNKTWENWMHGDEASSYPVSTHWKECPIQYGFHTLPPYRAVS